MAVDGNVPFVTTESMSMTIRKKLTESEEAADDDGGLEKCR